ncbi:MAG TPA: Hpt domain-containing protein, partial [Planctomycetaceae bacterium]|nr:Hpt domain-containing protein [Planctomycetaceae bacterium]
PAVFRLAAHSIRGACRTFGIERLAPTTQDLEMLALAGNLAAAGQLLETLRPDLSSCVCELQEFLVNP